MAWLSVWSEVQRLAYGPADATGTPSSLASENPERFILLVPAYPHSPGKKADKRLCVCSEWPLWNVCVNPECVELLVVLSNSCKRCRACQCFQKVEKTALDRGRTYHIRLTHDLDLQSPASYGHDLPACKSSRSSQSVTKIDWKQTDRWRQVHNLPR